MNPIRVIIIDDSAFMRKMLQDMLASDDRIEVIATARNGADGVQKVEQLKPDVITLDVEMPVMDGITALEHIMKLIPTPTIMLSSVTGEGASKTVQAITRGAIDFIQKPSGSISLDIMKLKDDIIEKVVTASQTKPHKGMHSEATNLKATTKVIYQSINNNEKKIVAIGTSTGGPGALQRVITDLPNDFTTPIVIVQHMPQGFTKSLADRLNTLTDIHVKEANHGEIVREKTAYIAPGDYHMKVRQTGTSLAIELTKDPLRHGHRPSVDTLFESLADIRNITKIAVILTGMGSDGAIGIKALKEKDDQVIVITESADSAIVYGMPKAAVKTNYVNEMVHLHQIGDYITRIGNKSGGM
ncbi:protein-glutamate methylesterase/protein-glutamine glutaminase [Oceanobacillus halotolerans]|uniref:protein-glutamate methylesterase/protein-glutamine glutaminase n=1 Tax=Oceanobacillus halotolerans TaxID=2663380 RepID=UPI0013D96FEB|nr:chemotaxis response regulator protein-glutamate methylesterase [Oceanobacillus halotolerans]